MPLQRTCLLAILVVLACQAPSAEQLLAQSSYPPPIPMPQVLPSLPTEMVVSNGMPEPGLVNGATTSNQMLWQQYQALQTGEPNSPSCSGCASSGYDRCGCNTELFPWIGGPGSCDQWCVGPKWAVEAGGLIMYRDDADWNRVIAGGTTTLVEQFDQGPGGRVFVTGYNSSGFGIQIGYEGINDWDANLAFAPVGNSTREINYQSRLNSVEINFLPNVPSAWKWFSGFRYVQLDEDFLDSSTLDKPIPDPIVGPAPPVAFVDTSVNQLLKNRLFGLQFGGRRDAWQMGNRLTLQTYANAGVYSNLFRHDDVDLTITTIIAGDDLSTPTVNEFSKTTTTSQTSARRDHNDIAFVGEAGIAAAWRLNYCTALRAGYQILALNNVGTGLEASFTPGLNTDTIIFHGLQFGLEYRR